MRTNLKFHAIAISLITIIVVVVYSLMPAKAPAPVASGPQAGERQVEIVSATWGENCNPAIEQALSEQQASPPVTDTQGNTIPYVPLKKVESNNVMEKVAAACNHQFKCELKADSELFDIEPMPSCYKKLAVSYRCFTFDRLNTAYVDQGDFLKIDCTTPPTTDAKAPQAH